MKLVPLHIKATQAFIRRYHRHSLRRRATVKKRIGVPYRVRELIDPWQWVLMTLEQSSWSPGR